MHEDSLILAKFARGRTTAAAAAFTENDHLCQQWPDLTSRQGLSLPIMDDFVTDSIFEVSSDARRKIYFQAYFTVEVDACEEIPVE